MEPANMLTHTDIVGDVRNVLGDASRGRGLHPHYLTAYQILQRLPLLVRTRLLAERGTPGRGSGEYRAAANVVVDALRSMSKDVAIEYFDNRDVQFRVGDEFVEAGYPVCALYKLREIPGDDG